MYGAQYHLNHSCHTDCKCKSTNVKGMRLLLLYRTCYFALVDIFFNYGRILGYFYGSDSVMISMVKGQSKRASAGLLVGVVSDETYSELPIHKGSP